MVFKIKNFFLLIILILLQSCSGGKIGNFLETSFQNIEEPKTKEDIKNNSDINIVKNYDGNPKKNKNIEPKIKEDIQNNSDTNIVKNYDGNPKKNKNIEPKIKEDIKNNPDDKKATKSDKKSKSYKKGNDKNISFKNQRYQPQSYKIIFILKDVDPKDPIEDLRAILRNSKVNFEIEKIERFFDAKDKSSKSN